MTEEQTHKTLSTYQNHHQINNPFFSPPLKNPTNQLTHFSTHHHHHHYHKKNTTQILTCNDRPTLSPQNPQPKKQNKTNNKYNYIKVELQELK